MRIVLSAGAVPILIFLTTLPLIGQNSQRVVKARPLLSVDAVRPGDAFQVAILVQIAEGYHVNAHVPTLKELIPTTVTFRFPSGFSLGEARFPAPVKRTFSFAPGTPLAVYEGTMLVVADGKVLSSSVDGQALLQTTLKVQACNERQCLAPATMDLEISIPFAASGHKVSPVNTEFFTKAPSMDPHAGWKITSDKPKSSGGLVQFGGTAQSNPITNMIENRGLLVTLFIIFLSGLALNTTPCVYPIIPITIGFFANQSVGRLRRTILMSASYVFGMAITYSTLGVVASMSRGLFGAALQKPIVLLGLASLMVGLSLSMFGVYEFRLPIFLNRFAARTTQSQAGLPGAFLMGLMMGIVAAPCIAPFVLGLLVHVGTKGDPVYGFFLFFVLALGLGLPYLVLGTFSGLLKNLPRSGEWMVSVRKVFGLVLLGMAIYFLMPLLGRLFSWVLVGFLAASAIYLIFWESRRVRPARFSWILRAAGLSAAIASIAFAIPKKEETELSGNPILPKP